MGRLSNRVVLLTGAAGGIGAAMARALAAHGARLALVDRDGPGLARLAQTLPPGTSTHVVDLSERDRLEPLVSEVVATHGELSVLICNAGLTIHGRFSDLDADEIDTILDVDLRSVIHLVRVALPQLRRSSNGHIVLVSSLAGVQAFPFQSVYSASKHGLLGYGDALRIELAPDRIGVTTLLPGTIATGFLDRAGSHDPTTTTRLSALMKRWGTSPERVAAATLRSITRNKGRVRVGWDCHALGVLQWIAPPLVPMILGWAARRRLLSSR